LIEEMSRPNPALPFRTLSILPDATLPEVDETLLKNLGSSIQTQELIARYATARILDGVKTFYEKRDAMMRSRTSSNVPDIASPACEPGLIAYFLRVAPEFGEQELTRSLLERSYPMGRCWMSIVGKTASYYTSPEWERVAIAALQDKTVVVKADAVQALAKHDSPPAKAAVLESFRYWHEWWKDRAEMNMESRLFEQVLLNAAVRAQNPDFSQIRDLCLSPDCKQRAEEYRVQTASGRPISQ
jgi:hypothetical protein